jgi:phosphinothricin acetyltransferase
MLVAIHIREAKARDLVDMLTIYNEIILNTTTIYSYSPRSLSEQEAWLESRYRDGFPVFVVEDEGRVLGYTSYSHFRNWPGYANTMEHSIYLHQDARGRGLGRRLLERLIDHATEQGVHALIASVDSENEASLKFHKRLGFEEVACFKQVGYKFGRWLDLYFLQRLLADTPKPIKLDELSVTLEPLRNDSLLLLADSKEFRASDLKQRGSGLIVAREKGLAIACAVFLPLDADHSTIVSLAGFKSNQAVTKKVLETLEHTTRLLGYSNIQIETQANDAELNTYLKTLEYKTIVGTARGSSLRFEKQL